MIRSQLIGRYQCISKRALSSQSLSPTIYALSTKLGRAAIGVVRVSGPQSHYIYNKLTKTTSEPKPRIASVRKLYDPESEVLLDEALTLFFKSPKTFTGEDLLELHLHGGNAIVKSVLQAIKKLHDPKEGISIRYAEQGEFSKRAFINGRFDLTEVEGIREMIDAETESQRVAALSSLKGDNKRLFRHWRQEIVQTIALMTTIIDFGEDQHLDDSNELFDQAEARVLALEKEIAQFLKRAQASDILLKGINITLLGPPNAGKSSLLNILANKEAAIVSDIAGTTRDVIDVPLDIEGYKVVVGDTAGIRAPELADKIEVEGIRRAKSRSLGSDLALTVIPVDVDLMSPEHSHFIDHIRELKESGKLIIVVLNKQDLYEADDLQALVNKYSTVLDVSAHHIYPVSCVTGTGIDSLNQQLIELFKEITLTEDQDPLVISARAQDLLSNDVIYGIEQFKFWKHQDEVVLATESLRQSVEGIGKITGDTIGVEEVLGVVFSSFCIGK